MSIKANVAKGSLVTQIQASDPDTGSNGRVTYSLYSEARLSLVDVLEVCTFVIEPQNILLLASKKPTKPQQLCLMKVNLIKTQKRCRSLSFSIKR